LNYTGLRVQKRENARALKQKRWHDGSVDRYAMVDSRSD
jgi:hypothetical protein